MAVREVDDGAATGELFESVGVELCLLLADVDARRRPLRLDDREREPVGAPQHIVDVALAARGRHAGDLVLDGVGVGGVGGVAARPVRLGKQRLVDVVAPGVGLAVVVGVADTGRGVRRLGGGDLSRELGDLGGVLRLAFGEGPGVGLVLLFELGGELGDLGS